MIAQIRYLDDKGHDKFYAINISGMIESDEDLNKPPRILSVQLNTDTGMPLSSYYSNRER